MSFFSSFMHCTLIRVLTVSKLMYYETKKESKNQHSKLEHNFLFNGIGYDAFHFISSHRKENLRLRCSHRRSFRCRWRSWRCYTYYRSTYPTSTASAGHFHPSNWSSRKWCRCWWNSYWIFRNWSGSNYRWDRGNWRSWSWRRRNCLCSFCCYWRCTYLSRLWI